MKINVLHIFRKKNRDDSQKNKKKHQNKKLNKTSKA